MVLGRWIAAGAGPVVLLLTAAPAWAPPPRDTPFRAGGGAVRCLLHEGGGGPTTVRCEVPRRHRWASIDEIGRAHVGGLGRPKLPAVGPVYRGGRHVLICTTIRNGVLCKGYSKPRTFVATIHSVHVVR